MRTFIRDPYLCVADTCKVDRDCIEQCDGCRRLSMGLQPVESKKYNTHYPVPTTLLRAYIDDCVDMRCNYWEPNKP